MKLNNERTTRVTTVSGASKTLAFDINAEKLFWGLLLRVLSQAKWLKSNHTTVDVASIRRIVRGFSVRVSDISTMHMDC